jgi:hypothetical protein
MRSPRRQRLTARAGGGGMYAAKTGFRAIAVRSCGDYEGRRCWHHCHAAETAELMGEGGGFRVSGRGSCRMPSAVWTGGCIQQDRSVGGPQNLSKNTCLRLVGVAFHGFGAVDAGPGCGRNHGRRPPCKTERFLARQQGSKGGDPSPGAGTVAKTLAFVDSPTLRVVLVTCTKLLFP